MKKTLVSVVVFCFTIFLLSSQSVFADDKREGKDGYGSISAIEVIKKLVYSLESKINLLQKQVNDLIAKGSVAGPMGPKGATGTMGIAGIQGPIGLTGATGTMGLTGPMGATGTPGTTTIINGMDQIYIATTSKILPPITKNNYLTYTDDNKISISCNGVNDIIMNVQTTKTLGVFTNKSAIIGTVPLPPVFIPTPSSSATDTPATNTANIATTTSTTTIPNTNSVTTPTNNGLTAISIFPITGNNYIPYPEGGVVVSNGGKVWQLGYVNKDTSLDAKYDVTAFCLRRN